MKKIKRKFYKRPLFYIFIFIGLIYLALIIAVVLHYKKWHTPKINPAKAGGFKTMEKVKEKNMYCTNCDDRTLHDLTKIRSQYKWRCDNCGHYNSE